MSNRKLTAQDIILIQKQLEIAEQFNELLIETLTEIGDAVDGVDPASIHDQKAAGVVVKIKSALSTLEKEVDEFNRRMK